MRERQIRYEATDKGKATSLRYRRSDKCRRVIARYGRTAKSKEAHAAWKRANPERVCGYTAVRRARKHNQSVLGFEIAIAKIYARCQELKQWFDVVVDHIIPLAKGGPHTPDNLQIIYRVENLIKGSRLDYHPRVVFA